MILFPRTRAFSILELLCGILVAAILAGLLIAVFARITKTAKSAQCLQKMRQLGVAAQSFIGEHRRVLPYTSASPNWMINLAPYVGVHATTFTASKPRTTAFLCPDDPARTPRQLRTYRYHQSFRSAEGAKAAGTSAGNPTVYTQIVEPSSHAMFFCVAFMEGRQLNLWTFDNAIWKEVGETLYPQSNKASPFTRPHYDGRAVNILYADGHCGMAHYPLPAKTWHFDGR